MIEKLHLSALDTYNMICNMKVMYIFEDIGSSVSTLKKNWRQKLLKFSFIEYEFKELVPNLKISSWAGPDLVID